MKKYAYVENNIIIELVESLPERWKNISGLDKSRNDQNFLRNLGWYIIEHLPAQLGNNQYIADYDYTFVNNKVIGTPLVVTGVTSTLETQKNYFLQVLRQTRNELLVKSDITQLIDVQQNMPEVKRNEWKIYRQALRDLPQVYMNVTVYDTNLIIYPTKPE